MVTPGSNKEQWTVEHWMTDGQRARLEGGFVYSVCVQV